MLQVYLKKKFNLVIIFANFATNVFPMEADVVYKDVKIFKILKKCIADSGVLGD